MTLREMQQDLSDALALAAVPLPSIARLTRALNAAKDVIARAVHQADQWHFQTRTELSVAAGARTVALPTDCQRILSLERNDSGTWAVVPVGDYRAAAADMPESNERGTIERAAVEGRTLRLFPAPDAACTLRLVYDGWPRDLAPTETQAEYAMIPASLHQAIVWLAATLVLPADSAEWQRYTGLARAALEQMPRGALQRAASRQHVIRGWED